MSEREKQISYISPYTWNLEKKMVLTNLFAEQEKRHRCEERSCGHSGGRRGGQSETVAVTHIYYGV